MVLTVYMEVFGVATSFWLLVFYVGGVLCFGGDTIWASGWDSWCLVLLCYYAEVLGPVDTYLGPLCVHSDPRLVLPYLVIP